MRNEETLNAVIEALQRNCGDIHAAARFAGISPHFLFRWMKDDVEAMKQIEEAQRVGWAGLESEAIRRGVEGIDEDVYFKGEVVGTKKVYSDTLLGRLLEARIPAYKKGEAGNTFNGPTQINIMPRAASYDEWLAMKESTLAKREEMPALEAPKVEEAEYVAVNDNPMDALKGLL